MDKNTAPPLTAGIDLGDKQSTICVLDAGGKTVLEDVVKTSRRGFERFFAKRERMRVAIETGTHTPWIHDLLVHKGHEVIVANARQLQLISKSDRKNDRNDARLLAKLARLDPELLCPVQVRDPKIREDLAQVRARDGLVRARANLINTVRGLVKSAGGRIPSGSAERFHLVAPEHVPDGLGPSVDQILTLIESMTTSVAVFDEQLARLARTRYPVTTHLSEVYGVGTLTALAFVLTVADPNRFKKSRSVGAYFGLVPRQQASSSLDPELRITKAGDALVRRLLVQSAQCNLRKRAADSDLRRHGLAIAARGGKKAKKRAVVAVARKIAVLLHRLWVTGEVYEPLRNGAVKDARNGREGQTLAAS